MHVFMIFFFFFKEKWRIFAVKPSFDEHHDVSLTVLHLCCLEEITNDLGKSIRAATTRQRGRNNGGATSRIAGRT